jgi:hypothetical protein
MVQLIILFPANPKIVLQSLVLWEGGDYSLPSLINLSMPHLQLQLLSVPEKMLIFFPIPFILREYLFQYSLIDKKNSLH